MRHYSFQGILLAALSAVLVFSVGSLQAAEDIGADKEPPPIIWQTWDKDVFSVAQKQNRHVLLDLYARWCHWCHFMEQRTYAHPDVRELVGKGYLAVKADQDASPDLAARYGDWGWPATIVFDPDGNEVAKFRGFLRPSLMANILYTIREQPDRVPELVADKEVRSSGKTFLSSEQRGKVLGLLDDTYDTEHAGWGKRLKFLQPDVIEFALEKARLGDADFRDRVIASMDAATVLVDKEWGGVFQYSHARDWSQPHYEKIMWFQSQWIRLYARASVLLKKPEYLDVARQTYIYLTDRLMSPDGAFYTSQDADVNADLLGKDFYRLSAEQRNKLGRAPTVDKNTYARENGWAISGLLGLYAATGDRAVLDAALRAANWVVANRALPNGGFRHGVNDRGGPFLSDTLAMGRAMLALYMATGDRTWLERSAHAADFIADNFAHTEAGFKAAVAPAANGGVFKNPFLNIEENTRLARFAALLHRTLGKDRFRAMAEHAMTYLTSDAVTDTRRCLVGIVLADGDLAIDPAPVPLIGPKRDERSRALHMAALELPIGYKRVDWWDPAEGPMPNPDITYPELEEPAAFACANELCSLPVFKPVDLTKTVALMMSRRRVERP